MQRPIPFLQALGDWRAQLEKCGCPDRLPSEPVAIGDAAGRVPAQIARTKHPCPAYRAAAMDGYAVRSAATQSARDDAPARLRVGDDASAIDTGGAMPPDFDAVVAIEHVESAGSWILVRRAVAAGKHVRLPGDDVPPGVAVGWPGAPLRPLDCAALLASGCTAIDVVARPRLAVIPTGDEVVAPGSRPQPGVVIESNSIMIAAEAQGMGADVSVWPAVKDDDAALEAAVRAAIASSDVVALLAGSSVGRRDRGAAAISKVGTIDVRGVATRPGRPVILGHAGAVPVVNLPGYPVSCHFAFQAYVAPLLRRLAGFADPAPRRARLSKALETDGSFDEWRAGSLLTAPGSPRAIVVPSEKIGGGFYGLVQADARLHLKRAIGRYGRYAAVGYERLRPDDLIARPLFVGPYDPLIEEMAALGGFRCRWSADESGEALDDGIADAVGVVVRDGDLAALRKRAGEGRKMLPIGARSEGVAVRRADGNDARHDEPRRADDEDPWAGAAAVAAGTRLSAPCTRYIAERFDVRFDEGEPAMYAIVWEDRPGRRFPWGIVLAAALSVLADVAFGLGWKSVGSAAEVNK